MKISLPEVFKKSAPNQAHMFPIKIGMQTMEIMQATIFHAILIDQAARQRIRQSNAINEIEKSLLDAGLSDETLKQGWSFFQKYSVLFEKFIFQNVLIGIRSQWDWYVSNLGLFVLASLKAEAKVNISSSFEKDLKKIDFKSIPGQLKILNKIEGISLSIPSEIESSVYEMSLIRNLGLHNRWEVDEYYLSKAPESGYQIGDIRYFEINELEIWHSALNTLINLTTFSVAKNFKDAPIYALPC